ncbi:MAG: glycosyltransferase [Bacteroidales bacterium]|nr:glycosyltransferase [Bacteroidales bacterium]
MKIVCMISSLRLGGAERQLLGLASALKQQGHDVRILTYHNVNFYQSQLAESGVENVVIEKRGSDLMLVCRIASYLKKNPCDVLISFLPGTSIKACLVHLLFPHFKLIVSERNFSRTLRIHDYFRLTCFRRASKIVCNNYAQEKLLREALGGLSEKLTTINNFVDLNLFVPTAEHKESVEEMNGGGAAKTRRKKLVVTARVCRRKNLHSLIEALGLLVQKEVDFQLDWYGLSKQNAYAKKCLSRIHKLGLDNKLKIHPPVSDVVALYGASDIFCLPSFYEGTSNSLAEALACGKCVVCSAVGDNKLYVKDGENGFLCNPSSVKSIAQALEKALSLSEEELQKAGVFSRQMACEHLSPELFIQRYQKLLKEYESVD